MSEYKLILKFDDSLHTLSKEKGISILNLSDILKDLYHAIDLDSDVNFTLTEIKTSSYATLFLCQSKIFADRFKQLHEDINQDAKLPFKEKKYADTISKIQKLGVSITAEIENDNWSINLSEIIEETAPDYYYETEEIVGVISKIGSDDLNSKSIIRIDKHHFNITISKKQETELKKSFKENKISALVKIKKSIETMKVLDTTLLDFTILENKTFKELVDELHDLEGDLFTDITDSVKAIREIRK